MKSAIGRIKLIFLGVFTVACVLIWGYQAMYVWPGEHCESQGGWWDRYDRICATPVPLWTITGRRMTPTTQVTPPKLPPPRVATAPAPAPAKR